MLRDDKALILGLIVDTFGTGAFAASSLIFFVAVRGVDVSEVGLAVTVGTILSFSTLPLAERVVLAIGARNAVAVASAVSTAGLILCGLTVGFWSILAASFVLTVGDRVHSAAWPILASQRFPDSDIAVVFGKFTAIKSATMGTGAALAAVAAYQLGVGAYTLLFVVNMVTTAASILLTLAVPSGRDGGERPSRRLQVWRTLADTRFMTLLISQACLSFVWLAPTTLLPLLIVEHLGLPAGVAALVVAVRYAMIFLLQVPIVNAVHGRSRW
ncbi:MFS transporter [Clavibacter michiganensis]|nr:MFS transporter [Clavibacter michiganensis]AWG00593.1 MFS transporter [Clavibacter michiganensis subsp. insidiosus]